MTSYLRPDERAAESRVNRAKNVRNVVESGASALAGGYAASKVLPFLNEYIPLNLALKGISKVAPSIGKFLSMGQEMGLDLKEGLDFVKNDLSKDKKQEPAKQSKNIIAQLSPELHQFIDQEIRKGRKVIEAGALAQNDKRFKDVINKLTKEHKTPWSNILESVYGSEGMAPIQPQSQAALQPEQMQNQQGQQQPGQGQAALMAILQKLQQSRGIQ